MKVVLTFETGNVTNWSFKKIYNVLAILVVNRKCFWLSLSLVNKDLSNILFLVSIWAVNMELTPSKTLKILH